MSHSYCSNFVHCVFSTAQRKSSIPPELQDKLSAYLSGIAKNLRLELLAVGGTNNHIHLLIGLPPTLPLSTAIQKLKANSSRWVREHGIAFEWQQGYGAFSVSPSMLDKVQAYIRNQAEHHKKRNFEEEFLALLEKSGIRVNANQAFG